MKDAPPFRRRFLGAIASLAAAPALCAHQVRPNSRIRGVQIGVITYSFRSMPDQTAEALLSYCIDCGISAIELMGEPAEAFAGIPINPNAKRYSIMRSRDFMANPAPLTAAEQKEKEEVMAAQALYQEQAAAWRSSAGMARFAQLRRLYNGAGVNIYAFKPATFETTNTDAEVDYGFQAAKTLGATHVTVELPTDPKQTQRLARAAVAYGMLIGYHQHLQAKPALWDFALAQSLANGINLDLGHYVAAGDFDALAFIRDHHARILSMHLKDRRTRANGQANLPWGSGDTPVAAVLKLMRDQRYRFPAAIELEYEIPVGSDAVTEVRKCLEYCRSSLTAA